jgi:hypothetical protein
MLELRWRQVISKYLHSDEQKGVLQSARQVSSECCEAGEQGGDWNWRKAQPPEALFPFR